MQLRRRRQRFQWSRRQLFFALTGAGASAWSLLDTRAPARRAAAMPEQNVYTSIGVRPFINLTATYTINGGALMLPEVKHAVEQASQHSVNLDELMEKVSERLAQRLGCESGIVTAGCAAALVQATAACVAGGDPEKMAQLPNLEGLRDEIIMAKQSRNIYDHAFRTVGAKIVEIATREEFYAVLGKKTAMIAVLGTAEPQANIRLEEMAQAGRRAGVPVLVDAAAELPLIPNPYLSRGADLVAYSGGKFLRGPQCAGLLLGRKDLVQAAWLNGAPHHGFGRGMKVGKEEIMGMLAAVETWRNKYDLEAEYRRWASWYAYISEKMTAVPGVRTKVLPPGGASPYPVLEVSWAVALIPLTAGAVGRLLREGEPRIVSHAEGDGHSFVIRPVAMKAEDHKAVAQRLLEIFRTPQPENARPVRPPAANLAGQWEVELQFVVGSTKHRFHLETAGNRVSGMHFGRRASSELEGKVDGNRLVLRSALPYGGSRLVYEFTGALAGDRLSGEVALGEYGRARWTARRDRPTSA